MTINLVDYHEEKPRLLMRLFWRLINVTFFRLLIVGLKLHWVRNTILRFFGTKITNKALVYHNSEIYAPWNLEVGNNSTIGPRVQIYSKDKIIIGSNVVISQGSFLCAATHDISEPLMPLVTKPIRVKDCAWIAAEAFIGPGVTIGEGAVVGARAVVFKDVEPWHVVGGNPARVLKIREMRQ